VATNGLLSLNESVDTFTPVSFPTNEVRIAPFWADADTSGGLGNVFYRLTINQTLRNDAAQIINDAFMSNFMPQYLVIITWFEIGYYQQRGDKV
jgi:hypothetical protein